MLRKPSQNEMEKWMEDAYRLSLDPASSGYPTYTDGTKTRDDFASEIQKAFSRENWTLLVYEKDGKVLGFIEFFTIPEDMYLQTVLFSIREDTSGALEEFNVLCQERYPQYALYFGFPGENTEACTYLRHHGWRILEHSYNDVLHLDGAFTHPQSENVWLINRDDFDAFQRLHDPIAGEMYWNSQRILEDFQRWHIWLYCPGGIPCAALYCTGSDGIQEIFGIDYADAYDPIAHRKLLAAAIRDLKCKDVSHVVYFNDEESQKVTMEFGFDCVGEYWLYYKKVTEKGD